MNHVDYTKQSPAILSLCTGMRGIERGLEKACLRLGWLAPKTVVNVEIEAFAAWNLARQMEQGVLAPAPIWTNLKTFCWEVLRGKVDFITGGYPCQPFSLAGHQKGTEDPRHLYPYISKGVELIRPVGCFFENVRNHLNLGYREVRSDLESLGYEVREGIFSAEEVGAPHKRDRLFILAIQRDVKLANSNIQRCRKERISDSQLLIEAGSYVDNTNSSEQGAIRRNATEVCGLPEEECESEHGATLFGGAGEVMDDAFGPGLSFQSRDDSPDGWKGPDGSVTPSGFPMPQGRDQYEWEEPRLKSRVGLTINGHNFTEDLLRMAGNGVVAQTAEVAFINLLKKHL